MAKTYNRKMEAQTAMLYWIQQEPMSITELADNSGVNFQTARVFVMRARKLGDIRHAGRKRDNKTARYSNLFEWVGEETIEGTIARAATYLRDTVATDDARTLARDLFKKLEQTRKKQ